jgi:mannitol-1-/sugar-/sorbitol-6-/2-deoxyglucose-6-phosphatase
MAITTAIFDMDGLLVDSEPLWYEAALESLEKFNVQLGATEYVQTTGLRTKEFLHHWFTVFKIDHAHIPDTDIDITERVIDKIINKGGCMEGAVEAVSLAARAGLKLGLASSSPMKLIDAVLLKMGLEQAFETRMSAEHMDFGKPHPQVFIDCAKKLKSHPVECICFEDSFNGLIAAKAARMKCIVVPHPDQYNEQRWAIADLKLPSLSQLTYPLLHGMIS